MAKFIINLFEEIKVDATNGKLIVISVRQHFLVGKQFNQVSAIVDTGLARL